MSEDGNGACTSSVSLRRVRVKRTLSVEELTNNWLEEHRALATMLENDEPDEAVFLRVVGQKASVYSILKLLLWICRSHKLIKRIRLYRLSVLQRRVRLLSVDCVGHTKGVADQFRKGSVVKYEDSSPLTNCDSFWCFNTGGPVIFKVKEGRSDNAIKAKRGRARTTLVELAYDQCDGVLAGHKSTVWVDIPLVHDRRFFGKLSCDLMEPTVRRRSVERLNRFARLVQLAIPFLELRGRRAINVISTAIADAGRDIHRITNRDNLFRYCTESLPKVFGCKFASIFTVASDSLGCKKLVLRKTSYGPSQHLEEFGQHPGDSPRGYYRLAPNTESSLTTWIALNVRSLRLKNLDDDKLRDMQLASYSPRPKWGWGRIPDSGTHVSFLGVPIVHASNEVLGVLRFSEKQSGGDYFTENDERGLEEIARKYIGPKLMSLMDTEISRRLQQEDWVVAVRQLVNAYVKSSRSDWNPAQSDSITGLFGEAMESVFPRHRPDVKRLYVLNVVNQRNRTVRHYVAAGELKAPVAMNKAFPLDGSLTGHVLSQEQKSGVIFLIDLPFAIKEHVCRHIADDAVCALACRIRLKGNRNGVLVVGSNRYDLIPETDGLALKTMSQWCHEFLNGSEIGLNAKL